MSLYDRDMRIPEPGWMMGDDIARGINQPPENHLPDNERSILAEVRDEAADKADWIKKQLAEVSEWSVEMETAIPAAVKALDHLADALEAFHGDTVGDDWDDEIE